MDGPTLGLQTGEGANALDPNTILAALSGRGIVMGGEVSAASAPFAVQVSATDAWFADGEAAVEASVTDGDTTVGTHVQPEAATVDLREYVDDTHPRKVVVCLARDGGGNAADGAYHVVEGEPSQAAPADFEEYRNTSEPALPDLGGRTDLVPLAAGWLGGNADQVVEEHLWDRRQRPDAAFRRVLAGQLTVASLTDPGGVTHDGALAAAADVTDEAINEAINTTPGHATDAPHDYLTPDEARGAVTGEVDVADLSGAAGTDGQLPFSTGAAVNWTTPPDEWGSLQALIDAAVAAGITPSFDGGAAVSDLEITGEYTWPDGTTGTTSPSAEAGAVSVLGDLGDVDDGTVGDRPAPSGSGNLYFVTEGDERGVYHDTPGADPAAWATIARHPGAIGAGDLGFDPATQGELESHATAADNPHDVTAGQVGALAADVSAVDVRNEGSAASADAADRADTLGAAGSAAGPGGFVGSGGGDLTYENGILTHWNGHNSINGERSQGEVERWVTDTADLIQTAKGDHRASRVWNAYYDGSDWRYQVDGEPAYRIVLTGGAAEMGFQTAGASFSGERVDWDTVSVSGGSVDTADTATNLGGGTSSWKTQNNRTVNGDHPDFPAAQDAIDFAESNGYGRVHLPTGDFGPVSLGPETVTLRGSGRDTRVGQVEMTGDAPTVRDLSVDAAAGGPGIAVGGALARVVGVFVRGASGAGIEINGDRAVVTQCDFHPPNLGAYTITIATTATKTAITGNTNTQGLIADDGTNTARSGNS